MGWQHVVAYNATNNCWECTIAACSWSAHDDDMQAVGYTARRDQINLVDETDFLSRLQTYYEGEDRD